MGDDPSTEEEIVEAAWGVLVEEGYDSFTTQAVADAADVSQSLVHYYFDTKEDLVFTLFEEGLEYLTSQVEARVDTDDPRERLLELARFMLRGEDSDAFEWRVQFSRVLLELNAQAPYDERLADAVAFDQRYLQEYVAEAVEEGIAAGQFRDVDPGAFAAMFVAAISAAQDWRAIFADDDWTDPVLAGLEATVENYLVAEDSP